MPADRSATYQLQTQQGKWLGAVPIQKGHATIGGKSYPTVKMPDGSVWMAQNLEMTWTGLTVLSAFSTSYTSPSCAYWKFDSTTYGDRGLYYNKAACTDLVTNAMTLCPGWHVPNETEFDSIWNYIYPVSVSNTVGFDWTVPGMGRLDDYGQWYEPPAHNAIYYCLQYNRPTTSSTAYYNCYVHTDGTYWGKVKDTQYNNQNFHVPIRLVMDDPTQFVPDRFDNTNTRVQYTKYWRPQVTFEFSESDFNPVGKGLYNSSYDSGRKWTKVSDSPNRWMLEIASRRGMVSTEDLQYGLAFLCNSKTSTNEGLLTPTQLGTCTCKIVSFGNMDNVETMDRSFFNCTSLTQIPSTISFGSYVANVAQMFAGCTEVTGGALSLYNQLKDIATITNHSDTFKNCGANTQTGLAELQQIPLSWGGMLAPPSTSTSFARVESSNPKYKWRYNDTNGPDWSTNPVLYIFTDSSLSQYAGINMRKTTTGNVQNGLTSGERYYMPAFVQFDSGSSGTISWVLTTTGYNGHLGASTSAGDMPGTLSYDNFGPTDQHFGTYDSSKTVYFCFLVTNVTIDNWGGLTDAYGIQGNNYYQTPITIKWFTA